MFLFNLSIGRQIGRVSSDDYETEHPTGCYHQFTDKCFGISPFSLEHGGECEPDEILQRAELIVPILCPIVPLAKGRVPLENI